MTDDRTQRALAILAAIGTGAVPVEQFTPDARWWWNGGLDLPVAEFAALIAELHMQTESGIAITPGLILAQDDSIMVEATSSARLTNGRIYDNRYIFLFHFDGDRVRTVREYSDSAHVNATFDLA
ncbi:nuclear transport factor 2 family protein [Sphingopyxis sp. KK2]|uniref:nuclear transport factor 2 family protein n=1 Tax=Sphingopyxis sp. KK2 TaxID=1855727 RepID=UPI0015C3982B|nr:hypothetical protein [Sphingopyxis sp. KK2]